MKFIKKGSQGCQSDACEVDLKNGKKLVIEELTDPDNPGIAVMLNTELPHSRYFSDELGSTLF